MATRGPKPGWKLAAQALASTPTLPQEALVVEVPVLLARDRENPDKISGEALHALAHRRGLSRSSMLSMSDAKIREQLRYLTYQQYESA